MAATAREGRLVLFDLDNTLLDRAAAFSAWAAQFVSERGLDPAALAWLERVDDDGYNPREEFFAAARARFGLSEPVDALVAAYRAEIPAFVPPLAAGTRQALVALRAAGWRIGIATNGSPFQADNLRAAGLEELVDGWAISSVAGFRKPDPRLFAAAAEASGAPLDGAWMVGDSPDADIGGAVACGLRSAWIARGRRWTETAYRPDVVAASVAEAVATMLQ